MSSVFKIGVQYLERQVQKAERALERGWGMFIRDGFLALRPDLRRLQPPHSWVQQSTKDWEEVKESVSNACSSLFMGRTPKVRALLMDYDKLSNWHQRECRKLLDKISTLKETDQCDIGTFMSKHDLLNLDISNLPKHDSFILKWGLLKLKSDFHYSQYKKYRSCYQAEAFWGRLWLAIFLCASIALFCEVFEISKTKKK